MAVQHRKWWQPKVWKLDGSCRNWEFCLALDRNWSRSQPYIFSWLGCEVLEADPVKAVMWGCSPGCCAGRVSQSCAVIPAFENLGLAHFPNSGTFFPDGEPFHAETSSSLALTSWTHIEPHHITLHADWVGASSLASSLFLALCLLYYSAQHPRWQMTWVQRPAQAIPDRNRRAENSGPQRAQLSSKQLHGNMPGAPGLLKFHAVLEECSGPITRGMQQLYLGRHLPWKDMLCNCRTRKIQIGLVYFLVVLDIGFFVFLFCFFLM